MGKSRFSSVARAALLLTMVVYPAGSGGQSVEACFYLKTVQRFEIASLQVTKGDLDSMSSEVVTEKQHVATKKQKEADSERQGSDQKSLSSYDSLSEKSGQEVPYLQKKEQLADRGEQIVVPEPDKALVAEELDDQCTSDEKQPDDLTSAQVEVTETTDTKKTFSNSDSSKGGVTNGKDG